jgi:hypothetical protein
MPYRMLQPLFSTLGGSTCSNNTGGWQTAASRSRLLLLLVCRPWVIVRAPEAGRRLLACIHRFCEVSARSMLLSAMVQRGRSSCYAGAAGTCVRTQAVFSSADSAFAEILRSTVQHCSILFLFGNNCPKID